MSTIQYILIQTDVSYSREYEREMQVYAQKIFTDFEEAKNEEIRLAEFFANKLHSNVNYSEDVTGVIFDNELYACKVDGKNDSFNQHY